MRSQDDVAKKAYFLDMQYLLFEMGFWGPYFYLKLTSLFDSACCKLT